jgi:hypothetical protein
VRPCAASITSLYQARAAKIPHARTFGSGDEATAIGGPAAAASDPTATGADGTDPGTEPVAPPSLDGKGGLINTYA